MASPQPSKVPAPEIQRGAADGNQLPKGAATELNQGVQQAKDMAQDQEGQQQQQGQDYQHQPVEKGQPDNTPAMPQGEGQQMLFGPTDRPMEPITAGLAPVGSQQMPKGSGAWLSTLQDAASDPDAPESIKNLFNLVVYHMNQGQ